MAQHEIQVNKEKKIDLLSDLCYSSQCALLSIFPFDLYNNAVRKNCDSN